MQNKTIWIINQYATTLETGMGGRCYYLARELAAQGYTVYLVASSYTHILQSPKVIDGWYEIENVEGVHFVWLKMPKYTGAHSKKRLLNWFLFTWKLGSLPKIILDKPDVIMCSVPSLISFLGARYLSRKFKARLIFDVRDMWPLTLIELGGYSPKHPFITLLQWVEDKACLEADKVTSNWPYAVEHFVTRGLDRNKFTWLPNGFSMQEFVTSQVLPDEIKVKLPKSKFIVGYTGTLGEANALDVLLAAAEQLQSYNDIAFVVVGGGRGAKEFVERIKEFNINNVYWIDTIPKKMIPTMLSYFDVCYVGFRKSSLYRFGNSLNKLPEYLMSGKPILYSIDSTFKPVDDAHAGITVPAEDPQSIAEAVLKLQSMTVEQREELGANGKLYAEKHYDYKNLADKLKKVMFE